MSMNDTPAGGKTRAAREHRVCSSCWNVSKQLRDNGASLAVILPEKEHQVQFFQAVAKKRAVGVLKFSTAKHLLISQLAFTYEEKFAKISKQKEMPKKYWLDKGFDEDKILQWPCVDDPKLGKLYVCELRTTKKDRPLEQGGEVGAQKTWPRTR